MYYSKTSVLMVIVAVAVATARVAEAQPACAQRLVPCSDYINSTSPPASCCGPLREAVTQEMDCLCNLFNTPGLLPSLGINLTDAVSLPRRCGIPGDLTSCTASAPTTPPSSMPPPVPGNDGNSLRGLAWTALPTSFLLWASMVFY